MVTVTTTAPAHQYHKIVTAMHQAMHTVSTITPRPKKQLLALLRTHDIALAFDGNELIGWLVALPYSPTTQELCMAYIVPKYREQGTFERMMDCLVDKRSVSLAVTFEDRLKDILVQQWGFTPTTLPWLVKLTGGKFIGSRFASVATIRAMFRHVTTSRPLYLVRGTHEK